MANDNMELFPSPVETVGSLLLFMLILLMEDGH
jgi:hypothetical protein